MPWIAEDKTENVKCCEMWNAHCYGYLIYKSYDRLVLQLENMTNAKTGSYN